MATLEDKLLGEKLHYYCSSSEDEDNGQETTAEEGGLNNNHRSPLVEPWDGVSSNTGPKGVLRDWQRYKQLETEQRREQEKEKLGLAKKLALSCRSHLDDEKAEQEADADKLIDDEFFQQYLQKRMQEMLSISKSQSRKKFGTLLNLENGFELLDAIDKEEKDIIVIVHLYEKIAEGCDAMNGCLQNLAEEHPMIKFCKLRASAAGVSNQFKGYGLPAILVYRRGEVIGNFVRLVDEFGSDFYTSDVESFLIQHGIIEDGSLTSSK